MAQYAIAIAYIPPAVSTKLQHARAIHYVTLDVDTGRVIHVGEDKGKACVRAIREHLSTKGVSLEQIRQASIDLSPAFIAGVKEVFPSTQITLLRR